MRQWTGSALVQVMACRLFGAKPLQAGKLDFFGTRPDWAVSYIAYTKFHLPRPVIHSPGQIFTRIGERVSANFPACISWTSAGLLSIGLLGTNFIEIQIEFLSLSFKKMYLKLSSAKMAAILSMSTGRWVKFSIMAMTTEPEASMLYWT